MSYSGSSIVDYLRSTGADPSFAARRKLAEQYGIAGYTGSAQQNTQLLSQLRAGTTAPVATPPAAYPVTEQPAASVSAMTASPVLPKVDPTRQLVRQAARSGVSVGDLPSVLPAQNRGGIRDELAKQYGYDDFSAFSEQVFRPSQSTAELYKKAYKSAGLDGILASIKSKRDQLNQQAATISENPWLSEASRSGKLRILNDLAAADIANDVELYNARLGEVNGLIDRSASDLAQDAATRTAQFNFLLAETEKEAEQRQQTALSQYLPDYLDSIPAGKPETITVGDTVYAWDAEAGKFTEVATAPNRELSELLSVDEAKKLGVPYGTTKGEAAAMGLTVDNGTGIESLTTAQQQAAFKLADDYRAASGDFTKVRDAYNRIVASVQNPSAAGDLALIFNYMKLLDPGSVVRENEFATAQNAGGVEDRVRNLYNKALKGERLSPDQRADFLDRSQRLYQSAAGQQEQITQQFIERAGVFGVPPELVITDQSSIVADPTVALVRQLSQQGRSSGDIVNALLQPGLASRDIVINFQKARKSPDEIVRYFLDLGEKDVGFSSVGNTSVSSLARSLVQQESGRRGYGTVGEIPTVHGVALGKYQIMPKFHFSKIGLNPDSEADRQKFLATPALQDKLFNMIISDLWGTYGGDPRKVAAAYYGGAGGVQKLDTKAGNVPQAGGAPSINSYVRSVLSRVA